MGRARAARRRPRHGPSLTVAALAGTFAITAVPVAALSRSTALAAASCAGSTVGPAAVEPTVPWAQRRFGLDRLAGIADGRQQIVAVLDSGVSPTHPQLRDAVVSGFDGLDPGGNGQLDCVGHGTAVASIIAARFAKGSGLRGVASGATILPLRVSERQETDDGGRQRAASVSPADLARWITQAVSSHATVINVSLVLYEDNPALRKAVEAALAHNVVVVAAAGNRHEQGDPTRILPPTRAY